MKRILDSDLERILDVLQPTLDECSDVLGDLSKGLIQTSPIRKIVRVIIDLSMAVARIIYDLDDRPIREFRGNKFIPHPERGLRSTSKRWTVGSSIWDSPERKPLPEFIEEYTDHPNFVDETIPLYKVDWVHPDAADFFEQISIALTSWIENLAKSPFAGDMDIANSTLESAGLHRPRRLSPEGKRITKKQYWFWRRNRRTLKGKRPKNT